jgi:predicted transcriptional regulator
MAAQNKGLIEQTHLSHDQLRRIMAEIVDEEFLRYIEPEHAYITTDKGHIVLKKGQ